MSNRCRLNSKLDILESSILEFYTRDFSLALLNTACYVDSML
jgi:hypothetical protein